MTEHEHPIPPMLSDADPTSPREFELLLFARQTCHMTPMERVAFLAACNTDPVIGQRLRSVSWVAGVLGIAPEEVLEFEKSAMSKIPPELYNF